MLLQALKACQTVGDRTGGAAVLHELAYQARMRGDLAAAEPLLRQAIQLRLGVNDQAGWVESVYELGMLEKARNQPALANDMLSRALFTARQLDNQPLIAKCLYDMALIHMDAQDYEHAETLFIDALQAEQVAGISLAKQGNTLHQLGAAREGMGDLFAAADYYKQSLTICEQTSDFPGQVANLSSLGAVYQARSRIGEAERFYSRALELARLSGQPELLAEAQHNLGTALYARGDYAAAFDQLWQSHRAVPDPDAADWMRALYRALGPEPFLTQAKRLGVDPALLNTVVHGEAPTAPAQEMTMARLVALRLRVGAHEFAKLATQSQIPADMVSKVEEAAKSLGG
jgi:tetratricopeptide (TPR) repeat protein